MKTNRTVLKHLQKIGITTALFLCGTCFIPHNWCAREAPAIFANDGDIQNKMARNAEMLVSKEMGRSDFNTGSNLFNGEWLFGTYMMSGMGFGQMAILNPERKVEYCLQMGECIRQIMSPDVRMFDAENWGNDPIDTLDAPYDHAAFLGYFNLLLSFHRLLDKNSEFAGLNDKITNALARRLEESKLLLLQTYPNEFYPVDNCAVYGSIGLYDLATGNSHSSLISRCLEKLTNDYTDPKSGLLYQSIDGNDGRMLDEPRGSGTCLGLYFLSFCDSSLSNALFNAARRELAGGILGFGGMHEYPSSAVASYGDIDSGPVILGYGISPTGFMLAGARIHGDYELFRRLYATAYLFGAPADKDGKRDFVTGGHIGNAIMFAMLTSLSKESFAEFTAMRLR